MSKSNMMTGVSRFAHLVGLARPSASTENSGDDNTETGARAEGDEGDEPVDDKDKDAKAKKAKAAEDPDDADADDDAEEMTGSTASAAARRRERARCASIFSHPKAVHNVALAASLAFETTVTRKEAFATLDKQPKAAPAAPSRSAGNPNLGPGGREDGGGKPAGSSWDRAFAKAGATLKK